MVRTATGSTEVFGWAVLMAVNLMKLSWVGRVCVLQHRKGRLPYVKQGGHREREIFIWSLCMD